MTMVRLYSPFARLHNSLSLHKNISNKNSGSNSSIQWKRKIQDVASWIPASLHIPPLWACLCQHSNKWKWGRSWNTTLTCRDGICPSITDEPTQRGVSQHDGSKETHKNTLIKLLLNIFQAANYVYLFKVKNTWWKRPLPCLIALFWNQQITTQNSANTFNYSKANDEGFWENLIIWAGDKEENGE